MAYPPSAPSRAGAYESSAAAERREILASRGPIERELAEIARKLERGQEMCLNEVISIADLKALTDKHAAPRQELESKLAGLEQPTEFAAHPGAAAAYARLAERLNYAVERDGDDGEAVRKALRGLIERVDFEPVEGLGKFSLNIHGKLAALLGVSERAAASHDCGVTLGAGTGFEPVTFRL